MATKPTSFSWNSGNSLASGCVRYWLVESSTSTITDWSPSAKNLTFSGTPTLTTAPGGVGNEYALDGTAYASGLDTGLPSGTNAPWTVAAWVKTTRVIDTGVRQQEIVSWPATNSSRVDLCQSYWADSGGQYNAQAFSSSPYGTVQTGTAAINDGNWHRVVATYDGTGVTFYLDGSLDRARQNISISPSLSGTVYFGTYNGPTSSAQNWVGSIGDVVVWNRALSGTEVAQDYADPWQQVRPVVSLTPGSIASNGTPELTTIPLISTVASGGTSPYSYQWQRSAYGAGTWSDIVGATSLTLNDTGRTSGTSYDYRVKVTDSAGSPATAYSSTYSAATLWPVDNANVHLSPTNWYTAGSSPATNAVTVRGGSCLSFGFTGTSARLILDMTNVSSPSNITIAYCVDYGTRNTGNPASTVTLASGLAGGTHSAIFWDAGQSSAANCWNVNGTYPDYCVNITGIQLDPGATLTTGPSWPSDKTLLTGDSIMAGATSGPGGSGDAGYSLGMVLAQSLNSEPCFDAFSSSGFNVTAGGSNVPPLNSRIGYHWNGRSRTINGMKRAVLLLGHNDGGSYRGYVATALSTLRTALGANVPLYVFIELQGNNRTEVTAGFASYAGTLTTTTVAGTTSYAKGPNDTKAYLIDFGSDWSPGFGVGSGGIWSSDSAHYNTLGAIRCGSLLAWAIGQIEGGSVVVSTGSRSRIQGI